MEHIKEASKFVLTPQCADKYFNDFDFFDGDCFKSTLSKCLGLAIILGSVLVKLPQILKIQNNKSGKGISLVSVIFDLSAITIFASYNFVKQFPFSSWGDSAFLAVQTAIIGALVLHHDGQTNTAILFLSGYSVIGFLMGYFVPISVLWTLQGLNIPILLFGKLTQAYVNYKNGNTGQLSAITVIMLFAGSIARIFTSVQETGDNMVILTMIVSASANTVILLQLLYYWNVDTKVDKTD